MEVNFSMRRTGSIGVEILDPNGKVKAWATDDVVGALLCHLLNEHAYLSEHMEVPSKVSEPSTKQPTAWKTQGF